MGEEKRTGLTARKYLTQLEELDININQDLEMLEEMKANASGLNGVDYGREKVQTSHMGDSLGNAVTRYVAFDGKLHEEIERFTSARNRIITEIRGFMIESTHSYCSKYMYNSRVFGRRQMR